MYSKCISTLAVSACEYVRGAPGDCVDGTMTRTDELIPASSDDCASSRTVTLPCVVSTPSGDDAADDAADDVDRLIIDGK